MNENTSQPIRLHPEHLTSLFNLAHLMPKKKFRVLRAILCHLEPGTLKSTVSREQIKAATGLSLSTVYRIVKEFAAVGLLRQWRGPYELKQCFYLINLPVEPAVKEFYSESRNRKRNGHGCDHSDGSQGREDVMKESDQLSGAPAGLQLAENFSAPGADVVPENCQQVLDPQIREVLDVLEANRSRSAVGSLLEQLGFLKVTHNDRRLDREGLLQWLIDRDCNTFSRFAELVAEFRAVPTIDLPMSSSVALHLHNKLGLKMLGLQWLKETGALVTKDGDGYPLPEHQIRDHLLGFMRKQGIRSVDELAAIAQAQHEKELASRGAKKAPAALHTLEELVRESEGGLETVAGPEGNSIDEPLYH